LFLLALVVLVPWRLADQRYYVSNTQKCAQASRWRPMVAVADGVARLLAGLSRASLGPVAAATAW
jgi:CDP-paratose 2-epimerase